MASRQGWLDGLFRKVWPAFASGTPPAAELTEGSAECGQQATAGPGLAGLRAVRVGTATSTGTKEKTEFTSKNLRLRFGLFWIIKNAYGYLVNFVRPIIEFVRPTSCTHWPRTWWCRRPPTARARRQGALGRPGACQTGP